MSRVDIKVEGVGEFGQQGFGSFTQLVGVLRSVLGVDLQQRFFAGERIGGYVAELGPGDILGQAAGPGRNGAIGVAGFFGPHGCQRGLELRRLVRADRCQRGTDRQ